MSDFNPLTANQKQLSRFLKDEGMSFADSGDLREMRAHAIRRLKRKNREQERNDPMGVAFGIDTALTIEEVKALANDMRKNAIDCKRFERVIFKIDDIADDMFVLKHLPVCNGRIVKGQCRKCNEVTPGGLAYRLELILADLKTDTKL